MRSRWVLSAGFLAASGLWVTLLLAGTAAAGIDRTAVVGGQQQQPAALDETARAGAQAGGGRPAALDETAQVEVPSGEERQLIARESSTRVDAVVIALWSIAAGMTVLLALFIWHTSPRRRLRSARSRSALLATEPASGDEPLSPAEPVATVSVDAVDGPQPRSDGLVGSDAGVSPQPGPTGQDSGDGRV